MNLYISRHFAIREPVAGETIGTARFPMIMAVAVSLIRRNIPIRIPASVPMGNMSFIHRIIQDMLKYM